METQGRQPVTQLELVNALANMTTLFKFALLNTNVEAAKAGMVFVREAEALIDRATASTPTPS